MNPLTHAAGTRRAENPTRWRMTTARRQLLLAALAEDGLLYERWRDTRPIDFAAGGASYPHSRGRWLIDAGWIERVPETLVDARGREIGRAYRVTDAGRVAVGGGL